MGLDGAATAAARARTARGSGQYSRTAPCLGTAWDPWCTERHRSTTATTAPTAAVIGRKDCLSRDG